MHFSGAIVSSDILCNNYFTIGWIRIALVFGKDNANNRYSYGGISFHEYGYEFHFKEQKGKVYYDTALIGCGCMFLDNSVINADKGKNKGKNIWYIAEGKG